MQFSIKKGLILLFTAGVVIVLFLLYANKQVNLTARSRVWNRADEVPFNPVGLVPGTKPGGLYFRNRIDAAVALYTLGKVKWLIVSGDNHHATYNEPQAMQRALMKKGIPESVIYCDYAGFTTLDSVVRAREVFGQNRITLVSQQFQNLRAIYLAQHYGIDAVGLNAEDVPADQQRRLGVIREYVARGRAVLDAKVIRRQPHFAGSTITPGNGAIARCLASLPDNASDG